MIIIDAKWEGTKDVVLHCVNLDWLVLCSSSDTIAVYTEAEGRQKRFVVPKGHLSNFRIRP